jgi:hypothetical protein
VKAGFWGSSFASHSAHYIHSRKTPLHNISLSPPPLNNNNSISHTQFSSILPSSFSILYTFSLSHTGWLGRRLMGGKSFTNDKKYILSPIRKMAHAPQTQTQHKMRYGVKLSLSLSSPIPPPPPPLHPPDFLSLTLLSFFKTETTFSNITTFFHLFSFNCFM